jgi:hypothetical protein
MLCSTSHGSQPLGAAEATFSKWLLRTYCNENDEYGFHNVLAQVAADEGLPYRDC